MDSDAAVEIHDGDLRATFLSAVGMLGTSLRLGGAEFVALPGGVDGYRGGHQTGLPLLAPWANRLSRRSYRAEGVDVDLGAVALSTDPNGLPIHGTMTAAHGWEVVEHSDARVVARFDYGARADLLAAFPFPHTITVSATAADRELRVETAVEATSDRAVPISFGWHPYLRLPRGERASWTLELPTRRRYVLDARGIPTGERVDEDASTDVFGDRTFDDLFALRGERRFAVEHDGAGVAVHFCDNYEHAQIYAPPGGDFVCFEPMTAVVDALVTGACASVEPGARFTAQFSVAVHDARS
jgi:galactose mutarotase-like enzyme